MVDYILDLPKTDDWLFDNLVEAEKSHYESHTPKALERFFPPQVKNKPPTRMLQDFTGEWTHPYSAPLSVVLNSKGQLVLKIADYKGVLDHYHYDSFRLRVTHSAGIFAMFLTFITGESGSVEHFRISALNEVIVYTRVFQA